MASMQTWDRTDSHVNQSKKASTAGPSQAYLSKDTLTSVSSEASMNVTEQLSCIDQVLAVLQDQQVALKLRVSNNEPACKDPRKRVHSQMDITAGLSGQSKSVCMPGPNQDSQQRLFKDLHTSEPSASSISIIEQLSCMEKQVVVLQEHLAALRFAVSNRYMVSDNYRVTINEKIKDKKIKAMLQHMGEQMLNKLARRCIPEVQNNAFYCRGMRLGSVEKLARKTHEQRIRFIAGGKCVTMEKGVRHLAMEDQHEQCNNAEQLLQTYLEAFPDLERGLEHLQALYIHLPPWQQMMGDEPVTADWLKQIILKEYDQCPLLGPVQQVLDCLILLTNELKEDLFVEYHHSNSVLCRLQAWP